MKRNGRRKKEKEEEEGGGDQEHVPKFVLPAEPLENILTLLKKKKEKVLVVLWLTGWCGQHLPRSPGPPDGRI
ncbi:hypothetical protein M0802_005265 [Mischocyttarus mexicanus]|nr:hypothetical protein M0802_005265 [Mischocyttarus mexicanus]